MGIWVARHPPPYLKSRALRGGFLKSWASQGRILYPKPWILQGGFLEKLSGIKGGGGGLFDPPLVPASLLSRTLSSHHPLHPLIRIQCHLRCRKLHLVALKQNSSRDTLYIPLGKREKNIISPMPPFRHQKDARTSLGFQCSFGTKCCTQNSIPASATFPFTPNIAACAWLPVTYVACMK